MIQSLRCNCPRQLIIAFDRFCAFLQTQEADPPLAIPASSGPRSVEDGGWGLFLEDGCGKVNMKHPNSPFTNKAAYKPCGQESDVHGIMLMWMIYD